HDAADPRGDGVVAAPSGARGISGGREAVSGARADPRGRQAMSDPVRLRDGGEAFEASLLESARDDRAGSHVRAGVHAALGLGAAASVATATGTAAAGAAPGGAG